MAAAPASQPHFKSNTIQTLYESDAEYVIRPMQMQMYRQLKIFAVIIVIVRESGTEPIRRLDFGRSRAMSVVGSAEEKCHKLFITGTFCSQIVHIDCFWPTPIGRQTR